METPKRILMITPDYPPMRGGVARYLSLLARYLKDRIVVIAGEHPLWQSFDASEPYNIFRMNLLYKHFWPRWLKTLIYLRSVRKDYDVAITSHVLPIGTAVMMSGIPYILIVHGMDIRLAKQHPRKRRIAKNVLSRARLVVTNSEALAKEVLDDFGVQSLVVYPCLETFPDSIPTRSQGFTLLTVSRLVERKGHTHVLTALAKLKHSGQLESFEYHIAGTGPMETTLRSMVHELGLERSVVFHGDVSEEDLQNLYADADIFVMPVFDDKIDKEGFGLTFIEAAAHATPSITTRLSGVDEAVIDGETGILVSADNVDALATAIHMLATDVEYRTQLGQKARTRAKELFLCKEQFAKLELYL
jgi:phosphatidyl-myo-inositol dimannoside synthase